MDTDNELRNIRFRSIEEFIPYREPLLRFCEECCGRADGLALFVALNEGVNNALQHGKGDIPEGAVDLSVKKEEGRLCVDIRSARRGLRHSLHFDRPLPPPLQESGRGLHIIDFLVDDFSMEATDSHVTLCLVKRREGGQSVKNADYGGKGEGAGTLPFSLRFEAGGFSLPGSHLLDMFSEGLVLWERETGAVLAMNEAARVLYGIQGSAGPFPFISEVYPDWEEGRCSTFSFSTATHRRRGGKVFPVRMTCRPLSLREGEGGKIMMMVVSDISPESAAHESVALAGAIQREFLPDDFTEEGMPEIRTIYRPLFLISGDMYGYSRNREKEVLSGFIVDVMGHGVPAALQTSALMILFRQVFEERAAEERLCDKLLWVNRMAKNRILSDSFAAALCFRLDLSGMNLEWCSAGIPAFLAAEGGRVEKTEVSGSLLGISGPADYGEGAKTVTAGDYFFFLSDGFLERPGILPEERLSFAACYDRLFSLAYSGEPRDDQTALGLHIR